MDSKKFIPKPFSLSATPKSIPKKFRMPEIPKYNRTTDPNEHVISYTCAIKGNDLEDDEIESVLWKKLGETLSNGAMIWYHNLPPNSIDPFSMLSDSSVKAHIGAIKVETRKLDLFKLKQNLIDYPSITLANVHNRYQLTLRVKDDQLGALFGYVYPVRPIDRVKRDIDREPKSNRDGFQLYNGDRRNSGFGRYFMRNERRNDRGQSSRGHMSNNGFNSPIGSKEASRLSEYSFNVDATTIVSTIGSIKNTKWPRPLQSNPAQKGSKPDMQISWHSQPQDSGLPIVQRGRSPVIQQ
uniref:Uncharacterized protein LOC104227536 n=1 Tax=Nicotiana sylvestris TaxID=4096 RepID=A0A1U7WV35_NICSY|nr:PREDICTED: uncharacterized protein LOC104227536 [Nicotiana sylvestris]